MVLQEDILALRPIEVEDIQSLQRNCWPDRTYDEIRIRMTHPLSSATTKNAHGVVALMHGEPIGYGQLSRIGRRYEICNLIVSVDYRSLGIGTAIILYLIDLTRRLGVPEVEIGVAQANQRALHLYQRLGFEEIRQTKMYLGGVEPQTVLYLSMHLPELNV